MTKTYSIQPNYTGPRLFGAPIGDFSLFQTILATLAIGAASFFFATFIGIVSLIIASMVKGRTMDFSISYRWFGLPVGIFMLALTGGLLGTILVRRVVGRKA